MFKKSQNYEVLNTESSHFKMSTNVNFYKILYEASVSRPSQTTVTLGSPVGPLFSACRAGAGAAGSLVTGPPTSYSSLSKEFSSHCCSWAQVWENSYVL